MSKTSPPSSETGDQLDATGNRAKSRLIFLAPAIGVAFFLIQIPFARIAFDSHHDGYMLAAAIGVKDGAVIHRDVVSQYGPITTLLHSVALLLPFGPALALRLFTAFQLAVTAALIADLGRVAPKGWPLRLPNTASAALVWIVLNDAWRGIPILPWSSVTAGTLLSSAVWLLAAGSRKQSALTGLSSQAYFLLAGSLVGLTLFTRVNVGAAAIAGSLTVLFMFRIRRVRPNHLSTSFAVGIAVSTFISILLLATRGALQEFFEQAITGPRQFVSDMAGPDGWNSFPWLLETFAKYTPVFLAIIVVASCLASSRRAAQAISLLALSIAILWVISIPRPNDSPLDSLERGLFLATPPGGHEFNALHLTLVASVIGCGIMLARNLLARSPTTNHLALSLGGVIALAGTVQVFPTWDSRHIWWGIPIALAVALSMLGIRMPSNRRFFVILVVLVAPTLPSVVLTAQKTLEEPRSSFVGSGFLTGMLGTDQELRQIETRSEFALARISQRHSIFLAADGDLAVLSGTFGSYDAFFVDWAPSTPRFVERIDERPDVLSDRELPRLVKAIEGSDYFIASRAANLTHLLAPPCIAGNCPGVEPNDVCMSWGSCRPRSTPEPLELVPDSSFSPVAPWSDWNVKVNTGFSYPEEDGAWITGHHARLTFDNAQTNTVRVSLYPFLPPEWTHIDINILTDSEATPIRLKDGVTTIDLPVKANTWNELVFRCDTLHRPSELGVGADERLLCAKVVGFEPIL